MKDISIIIVSWNVRDLLRNCLNSIRESSGSVNLEIIVIDNGSHDATTDMVHSEFPDVQCIGNVQNFGFSYAVNQGLHRAEGRLLLILNSDMELKKNTLTRLQDVALEHPYAGIIGPRLQSINGQTVPHIRRFPRLDDQLAIATKLAKIFPSLLNRYLCKEINYEVSHYVDSLRGSFFCIQRHAFEKIGYFDERFFVWFEEVDYCKRTQNAGFKILYTPRIEAIDLVGRSFAQIGFLKKQRMFLESMIKYFKKHGIWGN